LVKTLPNFMSKLDLSLADINLSLSKAKITMEEWVTGNATSDKNLALHIYCFFFTLLASAYIAIRCLW
jgi:hypothetical protein